MEEWEVPTSLGPTGAKENTSSSAISKYFNSLLQILKCLFSSSKFTTLDAFIMAAVSAHLSTKMCVLRYIVPVFFSQLTGLVRTWNATWS